MNNKDKNLNYSFSSKLNAAQRLELGIIVLDRDKDSAFNFLRKQDISINEMEPLRYCTEWLKKIKRAEEEKLKIRFSDRGPRINF